MSSETNDARQHETVLAFQRHLDLETALISVLEKLNNQMADTLDQAGIYGPKPQELEKLAPMVQTLQQRCQASQESRQMLQRRFASQHGGQCDGDQHNQTVPLKTMLRALAGEPLAGESQNNLGRQRSGLAKRLLAAQQRLAANQAALFYSMDFHRRYLMGVLGDEDRQGSYQASGHPNKMSPEKIIGRNC